MLYYIVLNLVNLVYFIVLYGIYTMYSTIYCIELYYLKNTVLLYCIKLYYLKHTIKLCDYMIINQSLLYLIRYTLCLYCKRLDISYLILQDQMILIIHYFLKLMTHGS